ncbi:P-loop containing nucleoside triphosphate hydrolase protein [Phlegmacium glaucopus]|nr:P-loop containing nucleoside triphosphate hydrolase protein [Phlegmacium glaucopus]
MSSQLFPAGTRHKPKLQRVLPKRTSQLSSAQREAIKKEVDDLPNLIKINYTGWKDGAKEFQLSAIAAQVCGTDVLLQAATGSGKTGIAAAPHLLPSSEGKVTLFVSPLLALQEEQVSTFKEEFKLSATAINSANGGCSPNTMEDVVTGKHQIVILSPEMLLSRRFIDGVLRKPEFGSRCLSVFIDEAHCISHWGNSFRKKYASLGIVRAFLPRDTPIVAVSATLTPRVKDDLITKLQLGNNHLYLNIGNERPNIAQVVRAMEHPMNTFRDLNFLVPENMTMRDDIKKGFVYIDDIKEGGMATDYLNTRICDDLRSEGLVHPYNASMSKKYRKVVMDLFRTGIVRILICTDAARMGCNIPDIDVVVQWKTPRDLSSWVQRAGRAARGPGHQGLAVMIVEKSAFEVVSAPTDGLEDRGLNSPDRQPSKASSGWGRGIQGRGRFWGGQRGSGVKGGAAYGILRGSKRGQHSGTHDISGETRAEPHGAVESAPKEGLYLYIQTSKCRRIKVFKNTPSVIILERCCDRCNPKLFDETHPGKPILASRTRTTKKGPPQDCVREALYAWRLSIKRELYGRALWGAHAILDDIHCEMLASVGPIKTSEQLALLLENTWARWSVLRERLFAMMVNFQMTELEPAKPAAKRSSTMALDPNELNAPAAKRAKQPSVNTASQTNPRVSMPSKKRQEVLPAVFPPSSYDSFFSSFSRS